VLRRTAGRVGLCLAMLSLAMLAGPGRLQSQSSAGIETLRHPKSKVQPTYPELARRMSLGGAVKIEVTVAPNGTVKNARVLGGHPLLASAALEAARKWRFEPAPGESTGVIEFKFEPQ
jgi:TonB family protein